MNKVLLTSVCRPIGPKYGDGESVGYELLYGQVTRAQGIFSPRAVHIHFALNYIAENLDAPTTVLQYPSRREFIREIKKGYTHIGISFILATFHHLKEMVHLIRKYAPQSRIILGGYGTIMPEEQLRPYCDDICREEGVAFMRKVLGEPPREMPYRHPTIISRLKIFSWEVSQTGMIFAGLGCPNGCDFCCTSHFFKRKHIRLLPTGEDIYRVVRHYLEINPKMQFTILDEDFLLNRRRAKEFHSAVQKGGIPLSIFCFASIKALSMYDPQFLLEMGIDGVWIGYEGKRSGYSKQAGRDPSELFPELRRMGILILASMIVGFDYQTQEIIESEHAELMRLKPTLGQFLIYGPVPGTPFYQRMIEEGKLYPEYTQNPNSFYRKCTGFYNVAKHPLFSPPELEAIQRWAFEQDYQKLGPSVFRTIEVWLNGYRCWKNSDLPILRKKAGLYKDNLLLSYPLFLSGRLFGPNRKIRKWIRDLEKEVFAELGAPSLKDRVLGVASLGLAAWTKLKMELDIFQHPRLKPVYYRYDPPETGKQFEIPESVPDTL